MSQTQDPAKLRISLPLRALAALLDVGLFAGLGATLIGALDSLVGSLLGGNGLSMTSGLVIFPLTLFYYLYFATELMMSKSVGKQLIGIEVRALNGAAPLNESLFKRFVIKHGWVALLSASYLLEISALESAAWFWLIAVVLSALTSLSGDRLAVYDKLTDLAVFPSKLPKADLATLSQGQNEVELAQIAADQVKKFGISDSVRRRAKSTLRADLFPCVVELMVYMRDADDPENLLFECFAQFVPNLHPNQFKLSGKQRGAYQKCRAVVRFESALQMETSYAALAKLPYVITTTTNDSVRVSPARSK